MEHIVVFIVLLLQVLIALPSMSQNDSYFYDSCAPSTCGDVIVAFPFSSSETICSIPGFEVSCDSSSPVPTLSLSGLTFTINEINRDNCIVTLSDAALVENLRSNSCSGLDNHFLPAVNFSPLQLPYWVFHLNFSRCSDGRHPEALPIEFCRGNESLYVLPIKGDVSQPAGCAYAALPVLLSKISSQGLNKKEDVLSVIGGGFPLQWRNMTQCWECEKDGGRCGYNRSTGDVLCFCKYGCSPGGRPGSNRSNSRKIILAVVIPTAIILLGLVTVLIKFRTRVLSLTFGSLSMTSASRTNSIDVDEFINNYRSMLPTQYSYVDLKKITDGFKHKLGEGGYGNVYKGKLANGTVIAVKVLGKSRHNGRDFVNEVATIGMVHHVNIIRLFGYCCDGSRRALVYEFMPQGSLGDLLSKKESKVLLEAPKLLEIAIGIARGIEYLHQGCDKRILHLDIKPHNVLLDSNLHPKISDFGLAKFFSRKDSVVPLTGARGTVGYMAPEVFIRNLGGVSHKSDVYSYGMLLLDMTVGRNIPDRKVDHSSNEYFPNWIYEQLNQCKDMGLGDSVVEEDAIVSRKMVMVGLWCIQMNPVDRPSMSTALGMLTGRLESIEMPPKPALFSSPGQEIQHRVSHTENPSNDSPLTSGND